MNYLKKISLTALVWLIPAISYAAWGSPKSYKDLISNYFIPIINAAIAVVASLALLAFFWGLGRFIFHAGDEDRVTEGRQLMVWGVIALFVMFSVWGLVTFLHASVFTGDIQTPLSIPSNSK